MNWLRQTLRDRISGHRPPNLDVQPGTSYRRKHATNLVETAEVREICRDHEGIPHVRFELYFGWPRRLPVPSQSRLLSLSEFATRYGSRVS